MPGTILTFVSKRRIADCHIETAQYTNDRKGLIAIYKAARESLIKGELFDEVVTVLTARSIELGIYKKEGN